jgi:hypothetical protein
MRGFSAGHGEKKTRKLDQFIVAMMNHRTVEAAAASVGVAASTAHRWLKDSCVVQRLAEARRDAMNRAIARLQEAAVSAVDCLCQIQQDAESESARVSAARCILEQSLRATELNDIEQRIVKLEAIAKSRDWKGSSNDNQSTHPPIGGNRVVNGPA